MAKYRENLKWVSHWRSQEKIAAWEDRYAKSFQQLNEEIKVINELLKKGK